MTSLELPDDEAFAAHARALTARNTRLSALLVVVISGIACAVDRAIYRGAPAIARPLTWMSAAHAGFAALLYLALRSPRLSQHVTVLTSVFVLLALGVLGYVTGGLGDLGTPWFHFNYAVAIGIILPVVPLAVRVLYAVEASVALLVGLGLARPLWPPHPMLVTTVTFLVFMVSTGVVVGHAIYGLIHLGLLSARDRDRATLAIEALNDTLTARVREQTQELRSLAAHLETTREDERAHIARELHDEIGQELAAMRYTLAFLRQRFERDAGSIRGNLDELESLLARTAATTRNIISDLRPRILDDLGLDAGVTWLLHRTEERAGLRCQLTTSCSKLDLDAATSIAAFRILQESLTNVVRHAQATLVEVELLVEGGELSLCVRDDGVGLPEPPQPRRPGKGGMGLIGMRERVDALGGTLRLESAPGAGTTVRVRLPIDGRAQRETEG